MTNYTSVPTAEAYDELVAAVVALEQRVAILEIPPVPPQTEGVLPIDLPDTATLRTSPRKVFAHYFTPYPISIDNKPPDVDYYTRNYLNPDGESGKHAAYGGLLRNRPEGREPLTGDWETGDMETEVRNAIAAGVDGFAIDILSLTSYNWTRAIRLVNAGLNVDAGFLMLAQFDMTTLTTKTAQELADKTVEFTKGNAWKLPDGRLVVSAFKAEAKPVSYWTEYLRIMRDEKRQEVAFFPLLSDWTRYIDAFKPISYGVGTWGSRSPKSNANILDDASVAQSKGLKWMQPVSIQDERPNQSTYYEAQNLDNLRLTWQAAIDGGSDHVLLVTWNDYSEGAGFAPSRNYGWTWLDASAPRLYKFKFGNELPIVRDALLLTHRIQHFATQPTYPQTKLQLLRTESSPARDTIEVESWLVRPGLLTITTATGKHEVELGAGTAVTVIPLVLGSITATITRNNEVDESVTSQWLVTDTPLNQSLEYYGVTSRRP